LPEAAANPNDPNGDGLDPSFVLEKYERCLVVRGVLHALGQNPQSVRLCCPSGRYGSELVFWCEPGHLPRGVASRIGRGPLVFRNVDTAEVSVTLIERFWLRKDSLELVDAGDMLRRHETMVHVMVEPAPLDERIALLAELCQGLGHRRYFASAWG
jgi:hypothetical protein